jgi:hypothetical protein
MQNIIVIVAGTQALCAAPRYTFRPFAAESRTKINKMLGGLMTEPKTVWQDTVTVDNTYA